MYNGRKFIVNNFNPACSVKCHMKIIMFRSKVKLRFFVGTIAFRLNLNFINLFLVEQIHILILLSFFLNKKIDNRCYPSFC